MINLDYRTNNRKWGETGILFNDYFEYIRTLGFLSNINHHINKNLSQEREFDNSIRIEISNKENKEFDMFITNLKELNLKSKCSLNGKTRNNIL